MPAACCETGCCNSGGVTNDAPPVKPWSSLLWILISGLMAIMVCVLGAYVFYKYNYSTTSRVHAAHTEIESPRSRGE